MVFALLGPVGFFAPAFLWVLPLIQIVTHRRAIAAEIKVGSVFEGKVVSTRDFGAFIEIAPGTDGMCHISELADGFVEKVENICKVGDKIKVKVINVDDTGRIKLSVKALLKDAEKDAEKEAETVES